MNDILDITPLIKRRQMSECTHLTVEVDDKAAVLSCTACGVALDPWWYIRHLAASGDEWERRRATDGHLV